MLTWMLRGERGLGKESSGFLINVQLDLER